MPINYTAPTIVGGTDHQTNAGGSTALTASFIQGIVDTLEAAADGVDALNAGGGGGSSTADSALGRLFGGLAASTTLAANLVFLGSSTTAGTGAASEANRYVNRFVAALQRAYPAPGGSEAGTIASDTLTWGTISTTAGIHGYNGGDGGTTSSDYLTDAEAAQVAAVTPVMVMHSIGSNDLNASVTKATFKANVLNRVEYIKTLIGTSGIQPVQVLVHGHKRSSGTDALWNDYRDALSEIAAADPTNVIFIDLSRFFAAAGVPSPDPLDLFGSDTIHLTDAGHQLMSDLLTRELRVTTSRTAAVTSGGSSATGLTRTRFTSDTFSGADVADINARNTDVILGGTAKAWASSDNNTPGGSANAITSNKMVPGAGTGTAVTVIQGPATMGMELVFTLGALPTTSDLVAVLHRGASTGSAQQYRLQITTAGAMSVVYRDAANANTSLGSAGNVAAGDRIAFSHYGGKIEVKKNGTTVGSFLSSAITTPGWHGFSCTGTTGGYQIDDVCLDVVA